MALPVHPRSPLSFHQDPCSKVTVCSRRTFCFLTLIKGILQAPCYPRTRNPTAIYFFLSTVDPILPPPSMAFICFSSCQHPNWYPSISTSPSSDYSSTRYRLRTSRLNSAGGRRSMDDSDYYVFKRTKTMLWGLHLLERSTTGISRSLKAYIEGI